jgi:hypothetical protein
MPHSPAPWKLVWIEPPRVQYAGWFVKMDDEVEFPIAFVTETIGGIRSPQLYNARLIAAAPKLLAACKAVREGWGKNLTEPMALLNAAINEAERGNSRENPNVL